MSSITNRKLPAISGPANNYICSSIALRLILLSLFPSTASFLGGSNLRLPLRDARTDTEIAFRMRTGRRDALLVLAAGKFDYCLVMLQEGTLLVSIAFKIETNVLINRLISAGETWGLIGAVAFTTH